MNTLKRIPALFIFIALLFIAGCGQGEIEPGTMSDPCGVIFAASSEKYPDKLREASVGSDLVDQFPPVSLNESGAKIVSNIIARGVDHKYWTELGLL